MDPSPSDTPATDTTPTEPAAPAAATPEASGPKKVTIMLQAVGDAPILVKKKMAVAATNNIAWLTVQIRKLLNLPADKSLFFYISQTFAPSPDHTFEVLSQCYSVKSVDGSKSTIQLQYSTTPAWG